MICDLTGNQWKYMMTRVMWSCFLVCVMSRAALCWRSYRQWMIFPGKPKSKELLEVTKEWTSCAWLHLLKNHIWPWNICGYFVFTLKKFRQGWTLVAMWEPQAYKFCLWKTDLSCQKVFMKFRYYVVNRTIIIHTPTIKEYPLTTRVCSCSYINIDFM